MRMFVLHMSASASSDVFRIAVESVLSFGQEFADAFALETDESAFLSVTFGRKPRAFGRQLPDVRVSPYSSRVTMAGALYGRTTLYNFGCLSSLTYDARRNVNTIEMSNKDRLAFNYRGKFGLASFGTLQWREQNGSPLSAALLLLVRTWTKRGGHFRLEIV